MPWRKGTGSPLAMNEKISLHAVDFMLFEIAGVVRDIVEQVERGMREQPMHGFAGKVGDNLTVRQCAIDACTHCTEVALAEF